MDSANSYGTHLLYPFSARWIYGDAVFVLEPWLWLILGAALGGVLYSFASLAVYAAGAILGLVLALFFASLVGIGGSWLLTVLALAGVGAGAFGGRYLGSWLTILSSAVAGAYFSVTGLALLFGQQTASGMMPVNTAATAM